MFYEEAAHHKLCLVGVPGDAHGIFLHELYATWFSCRQLTNVDGGDRERLRTRPLAAGCPTPAFMYDLGGALGAALAGHEDSRARVETWVAKGTAEPWLVALSRDVLSRFEGDDDPVRLAERVASLHARFEEAQQEASERGGGSARNRRHGRVS